MTIAEVIPTPPVATAPGTTHGYHVNTFGFLTGEIVRRVSGESIGAFFRDEVASPLDADFHFGFGAEHDRRTAEGAAAHRPSACPAPRRDGNQPEDSRYGQRQQRSGSSAHGNPFLAARQARRLVRRAAEP